MRKQCLCWLLPALAVLVLAAAPLAAQDIPAGPDLWASPSGSGTWIELNSADWETICGVQNAPAQQITFEGVPFDGMGNASTIVSRDQDAVFDSDGVAQVPVHMSALQLQSEQTSSTPCGALDFQVHLNGPQKSAPMEIRRDSAAGGYFFADLPVDAVVDAYDHGTGQLVNSVEKAGVASGPASGTPWSYVAPPNPPDPNAVWFPGVATGGTRVVLSRPIYPIGAWHFFVFATYTPLAVAGTTPQTKAQGVGGAQPSASPQRVGLARGATK